MTDYLWITLGAAGGANLRFAVSNWTAQVSPAFPYGTLAVNATGSLVLGVFLGWASTRVTVDPHWRLLVGTGFCGAYTTFSAYSWETVQLAESGRWLGAAMNVLANNVLALAALVAGVALVRMLSAS